MSSTRKTFYLLNHCTQQLKLQLCTCVVARGRPPAASARVAVCSAWAGAQRASVWAGHYYIELEGGAARGARVGRCVYKSKYFLFVLAPARAENIFFKLSVVCRVF